ncbi:MAG TPA: hypothetical protein VMX12_02805 [Acidimicrobiia bacterium]|nr:hypothetical protein [Acidimicrobiia bacterium]
MGSRGMKRRRKDGPEHLPKVGSSPESAAHQQALEREAIADTMGLANAPAWIKWGLLTLAAVVLVVAVIALTALD